MKKIFILVSLATFAIALPAQVSYTAFAALKITSTGGADAKVRVYESNLFSADKDTEYGEAAFNPNEGSSYTHTVKFFAPCAWGNAAEVCTNDIYGTTMTFGSNQIDANYVITFTAVGGTENREMYLKDNLSGRMKLIVKNDTMKFSQPINTTEAGRFEIVKKVIPAEPTICHQYGNLIITGHKGAKVKVLDMADAVAIAEQTLATDDEVISLSTLTKGEMYQVVMDDGEPMLIRIQ